MIRTAFRIVGEWLLHLSRPPAPREPVRITNRAQLLREPRDGDACDAFELGEPGQGTCQTDGHYLCMECTEMSPETLRERKGLDPEDDDGPVAVEVPSAPEDVSDGA